VHVAVDQRCFASLTSSEGEDTIEMTQMTQTSRQTSRGERVLATRNRRRARSSHELTELFTERSDLLGVSPVADFFVESVRWSA
jgi:hypothetical protein